MQNSPLYFVRSGGIRHGRLRLDITIWDDDEDASGLYWASDADSNVNLSSVLDFDNTVYIAGDDYTLDRYYGFSLRCLSTVLE